MVAYSFRPRFVEPILAGTKRQTLRAYRKGRVRHACIGQTMQLYTGMRTVHCRKIMDVTCRKTVPIELWFGERSRLTVIVAGVRLTPEQAQQFARDDGFDDCDDFIRFWMKEHDPLPARWLGVIIYWEFPRPSKLENVASFGRADRNATAENDA